MPKNIVFCADGSWNHPNEVQDGTWSAPDKAPGSVAGTTNVFKFYDALASSPTQLAFYDKGVGTHGDLFKRLEGGALGQGLFENIKDGYSDIAQTYQDGDAVHLFGFSRGAYTARSLAGMIAACGIPAPGKFSEDALEDTFAAYRERDPERKRELIAELKEKYGNRDVKIAQLGVWDTVGSMGIPGKVFALVDRHRYGFLDTKLHPNVGAAWHALAVDEHRREFEPTLFTGPFAPGQQVDQVWFPGSHSDVGGGTRDPALSDIPLGWMMKKAASLGLEFDPIKYAKYTGLDAGRALDPINPSWNPLWGPPHEREIAPDATIANSVEMRMKALPDYRPRNLRADMRDRLAGSMIPRSMKIEDVVTPSAQEMTTGRSRFG